MDGNRRARRSAQFASQKPTSRHTRGAAKRGVRRIKPVTRKPESHTAA